MLAKFFDLIIKKFLTLIRKKKRKNLIDNNHYLILFNRVQKGYSPKYIHLLQKKYIPFAQKIYTFYLKCADLFLITS